MEVKPCCRKGCVNIACDRHSLDHGYICYECFKELVSLGPTVCINTFMSTEKINTVEDTKRIAKIKYDKIFILG